MKLKAIPFLLFLALPLGAGTHALTMHQAVERALRQNPDLIMARLDEQKAVQQVRVAKDPFIPKVYVGSGLAYTYGFPMSIEGSAPSCPKRFPKKLAPLQKSVPFAVRAQT